MPDPAKPALIIASPQMHDPFFERAVVLIWHHDEDGAIGIVINKTLHHSLPEVLDLDEVDLSCYVNTPVGWGGPVEAGYGTVVTRAALDEGEGWSLPDGLAVTRSHDALVRLLAGGAPILLCLGYAGWGPGQLEQELELGGWLFTDCDAGLIFDAPTEARYELALASLGLTPHTVWMQPITE